MPEQCSAIINLIEQLAPQYLAESWDNVGLQIGGLEKEIYKVMVCLEVTNQVIDEAISKNVDMLIVHHPLIFKPMRSVRIEDGIGNLVHRLIKQDIILYCAHTNLDVAFGGLNDAFARALNLVEIEPLMKISLEKHEKDILPLHDEILQHGMGRIGRLPQSLPISLLCEEIKRKLKLSQVRLVGDVNQKVQKIGLCTGSGSEYILNAFKSGCDCFITGDVKYHEAQYALQLGIPVIDAGHFEVENFTCKSIVEYLREKIEELQYDVEVVESAIYINPFQIL